MIRFSERLKEDVRRAEAEYASAPPMRAINRAETRLVEDQRSEGEVRGHSIRCDEPDERGGTNSAPAPLEYLLASLGFCQQVMIARNAAARDLRLEGAHVQVKGYFDRRGGHIEGVPNRGFEEIRMEALFEGPEPPEAIRDLMDAVERQCYAYNTLRRAAVIRTTVRLNGEVIDSRDSGAPDGS